MIKKAAWLHAKRNRETSDMMTIEQAIVGRQSIRGYLDKPVPRDMIERVLLTAGRAPSGSNIQPWRVYVLQGAAKDALSEEILALHKAGDEGTQGVQLLSGQVARSLSRAAPQDRLGALRPARHRPRRQGGMAAQHRQNYTFFGAPVGLIFTIDRDLELGSWLDTGMFIQSVMIAARGEGLETCPQAAFCPYHDVIQRRLDIPPTQQVVCGMAIGYADPEREDQCVPYRENSAVGVRDLGRLRLRRDDTDVE